MPSHVVHFGLMAVVGLHVRHFSLVLHDPAFGRVILMCLRDALEVKFVGIALAVHFGHDVLVIVVAKSPAQLVVVHVGFALAFPPALCHLIWVCHLELAIGAFPGDDAGIVTVGQELQQELPQLDLP